MKIYSAEDSLKDVILKNRVSSTNIPVNITAEKKDLFNESLKDKKLNKKIKAAITELDFEHPDLLYASAIFVSTVMNGNDDVFLPVHTWNARYTPIYSPFNENHEEKEIIGHIIGVRFLDKDGEEIEDTEDDDVPDYFDIEADLVVYKSIYPEIAEDILENAPKGEKFVSMEATLTDFDYALFDENDNYKVIARNEKTAFLTKYLRAYGGKGIYQGYRIGRVLSDFRFNGVGNVDVPANKKSFYTKLDNKKVEVETEAGLKSFGKFLYIEDEGDTMVVSNLEQAQEVIDKLSKEKASLSETVIKLSAKADDGKKAGDESEEKHKEGYEEADRAKKGKADIKNNEEYDSYPDASGKKKKDEKDKADDTDTEDTTPGVAVSSKAQEVDPKQKKKSDETDNKQAKKTGEDMKDRNEEKRTDDKKDKDSLTAKETDDKKKDDEKDKKDKEEKDKAVQAAKADEEQDMADKKKEKDKKDKEDADAKAKTDKEKEDEDKKHLMENDKSQADKIKLETANTVIASLTKELTEVKAGLAKATKELTEIKVAQKAIARANELLEAGFSGEDAQKTKLLSLDDDSFASVLEYIKTTNKVVSRNVHKDAEKVVDQAQASAKSDEKQNVENAVLANKDEETSVDNLKLVATKLVAALRPVKENKNKLNLKKKI